MKSITIQIIHYSGSKMIFPPPE